MADVEEEEAANEAEAEEAIEAPQEEVAKGDDEEAPQELEEAGEEEEEDDKEEDKSDDDIFEMLDEETEDTEEEGRMYREYLDLTKQIDCQNALINDMRERSHEIRDKPCQTRRDKTEYQELRICIEKENLKLHQMMNRAVQLQNTGSKRKYGDLELATTSFDSSLFQSVSACIEATKCCATKSKPLTAQQICDALDNSDSSSENECCF